MEMPKIVELSFANRATVNSGAKIKWKWELVKRKLGPPPPRIYCFFLPLMIYRKSNGNFSLNNK